MESRGSISADFLLASLIILITLSSLVSIAIDRIDTANSIAESSQARITAENIAEHIETTYIHGEGYYTTYTTPKKIFNNHYGVIINCSGLYLFLNGKTCYSYLGSMEISGADYPISSKVILKPDRTYNISNIKDKHNITRVVIKEI